MRHTISRIFILGGSILLYGMHLAYYHPHLINLNFLIRKGATDALAAASHEKIAERAFEIFRTRGATPGHDLDDWLQAERELVNMEPPKRAESYSSKSAASYQSKPRRQAQSSFS